MSDDPTIDAETPEDADAGGVLAEFITGTVTDSTTSAGIEGATVEVVDASSGTTVTTAVTDPSGNYTASVAADTYDLVVEAREYDPATRTGVIVGTGETKIEDFALDPTNYKVRGEFSDVFGVGVVGRNTAESGVPIGVRGSVPNSGTGYGFETPDDAFVAGFLESESQFEAVVDGDTGLRIGPTEVDGSGNTAGGRVALGSPANVAGAVGTTIGGGGAASFPNEATGKYGTIGGGVLNSVFGSNDTIGGGSENRTGTSGTTTSRNATIGGGARNTANGPYSTVGGGFSNTAGGSQTTVGGGRQNTASESFSTIGGGANNTASGSRATVGGGELNTAGRFYSTVGGGTFNRAFTGRDTIGGGSANRTGTSGMTSSLHATVPGGQNNVAEGAFSFAAGRRAKATNDGQFVWADSNDFDFAPSEMNRWSARATGGAQFVTSIDGSGNPSTGVIVAGGSGSWSSLSARSAKENVRSVDPETVLEGVRNLEVAEWNYESQDEDIRHLGPFAGEFRDTFGLGDDPERITTVDADGVLFAAVQGLAEQLDEKDDRIEELEAARQDLEAENEQLRDRLATVEDHLGLDSAAGPAPADD